MIYTNIKSNCIRKVDMCGNIVFRDEFRHPDRTLQCHDLVYVKSGGFNVIVEDELIESRTGDIMFLPAYKHHYPYADNLENSACYYIHFSNNDNDYIEFERNNLNNDFFCVPSKLAIKNNLNLVNLFHELTMISSIGEKENDKLINSILYRILAELDLLVHNQNKFKYSELTNKVIDILIENVEKSLSINDLAGCLNFSPRTIQKHFKKDTGRTIRDYYLQLKLDKSKYYLNAYPDIKIKEIASILGFYDEFHYSKVFKKVFGISPKQYKKT